MLNSMIGEITLHEQSLLYVITVQTHFMQQIHLIDQKRDRDKHYSQVINC